MEALKFVLDPGKLRYVIAIYRNTESADIYGGYTSTPALVATVRAAIDYKNGIEKELSDKETVVQRIIFTVRYTDVTERDYISYNGLEFDIDSIDVVGPQRYLRIYTQVRK